MSLIPKLLYCNNNILHEATSSLFTARKVQNRKSTILRALEYANKLGITSRPQLRPPISSPPWHFRKSSVLFGLAAFPKSNTSSLEYQRRFGEYVAPFRPEWKMIYTDGSKTLDHTAFAVVNADGETITKGQLPYYCSVYTAEAIAIYNAIIVASKTNEKTIICSDSKSTISGIMNIRNKSPLISSIRSILIEHQNKVKIMWIPGHVGIKGNELADQKAKAAAMEPLHTFDCMLKKDICGLINKYFEAKRTEAWRTVQHHYASLNTTGTKPNYQAICRTKDITAFIRLRIGHTIGTHSHILNGERPPPCPYCTLSTLTVKHLLDDCTHFMNLRNTSFNNHLPSEILKTPSQENIEKMTDYLIRADLRKLIYHKSLYLNIYVNKLPHIL